jgi:hypothetical protein
MVDGSPGFYIIYAYSKMDAVKRSDLQPELIYDVWLLDEWIDFCEKRRGPYQTK